MGQVLFAGEKPHERPALLGDVIADRAAQHRKAGLNRVENRTLRDRALVVLEEQNRRLWDHGQIAEALPLVVEALRGAPGAFAVQAAIAALHCQAARAEDTDWPQILRLYDWLETYSPRPSCR